ncbi:hypothetical protein [Lentzea sp. E54]|uniref:hypothetical protein n=1 Tax=Lentzea xerophila TaxID=3435883 RepID=UPI003DA241E4
MITGEGLWLDRVRFRLAGAGASKDLIDAVAAEVAEHCAMSGERPEAAFGDPDEYARVVLRERVPLEVRADLDRFGMSGAERRSEVVAQFGLLVLVAGMSAWIGVGLLLPVTVAGATGTLLLAVGVIIALCAVHVMKAEGHRPSVIARSWYLALAMGAGAAAAFLVLPDARLTVVQAPLIAVLGAAVLGWALIRKPTPKAPPVPADGDEWLSRLHSLLVGRYRMPVAQAKDVVAELRSHLGATGGSPLEEFGTADQYAATVAEGMPDKRRWI